MIWLKMLENEDSYKDLEFIISKVKFYSSYCSFTSLYPVPILFCPRYFELCSRNKLIQYEFLLSSSYFAFSVNIIRFF